MTVEFAFNEFTSCEIMQYLKKAYGMQINGSPFNSSNLVNWLRMMKLPEAYGGHKILKIERIKEFNNYAVFTLEGITREVLTDIDMLEPYFLNKKLPKTKMPRKQRTALYYQILDKVGKQYTRKTKKQAMLPDNWKEIGIKQNQLAHRSKRKSLG